MDRTIMIPTEQVHNLTRGCYFEVGDREVFYMLVLAGPLPGWRLGRRRKANWISCKN